MYAMRAHGCRKPGTTTQSSRVIWTATSTCNESAVVGDEQRLNWLDALRFTNQQTRVFGINYQIGTQQAYPYAGELDPGQLTLHQSVMKITLRLLHEGDLISFLGTLAQQRAGVFSVDQCTMERVEARGSARNRPNVRADCDLAWITLRPPVAAGEPKT